MTMADRIAWWVALACACLWARAAASEVGAPTQQRGLTVSVSAPWPASPLLHEAAELIAMGEPDNLWAFVDAWTATHDNDSGDAEGIAVGHRRSCLDEIVACAREAVGRESDVRFIRAGLLSRQASPRVELFRSLASEAPGPESSPCCVVRAGFTPIYSWEGGRLPY